MTDDLVTRLRALAAKVLLPRMDDMALQRQADARDAAYMKMLWHKEEAEVANERAEKAEAEAAALRETLDDIAFWRCGCGATWASDKAKQALSHPGPGAAMLERVEKLEAVAEDAGRFYREVRPNTYDPQMAHYDLGLALAALESSALHAALATMDANAKDGTC